MSQKLKKTFDSYLSCNHTDERCAILENLQSSSTYLPVTLTEDLLCLDLDLKEKIALVKTTTSPNNLSLEHFFTKWLPQSHQDLAVTLIIEWAERTEGLLWFRLYELVLNNHLPQRVTYTILDRAFKSGAKFVIDAIANSEGVEELSSAFHSLLLFRALQWDIKHKRLINLAKHILEEVKEGKISPEKATTSSVSYLARFDKQYLNELLQSNTIDSPWKHMINVVWSDINCQQSVGRLQTLLKSQPSDQTASEFKKLWPTIWTRQQLSVNDITSALKFITATNITRDDQWQLFTGIEEQQLVAALLKLENEHDFYKGLSILKPLITRPIPDQIIERIKSSLQGSNNPEQLIPLLNVTYTIRLENGADKQNSIFHKLIQDEADTIKRLTKKQTDKINFTWKPYSDLNIEWQNIASTKEEFSQRRHFFDVSYRGTVGILANDDSFWTQMANAWQKPKEQQLDPLAEQARKAAGIFTLCYINTLGRFQGTNRAALKLLDFIRSEDDAELRAVVRSLAGIKTPRAWQELVSCLTRPNININLQMEITQLLQDADLSGLQSELRSAINDLKFTNHDDDAKWELRDALNTLIIVDDSEGAAITVKGAVPTKSDQDLDKILQQKIPYYNEMSSEVRRALRTAEFFHSQVDLNSAKNIELSPVIDMQYKALEILFRENFEAPCTKVIQQGVIQRKLDVLGYARPIPAAMTQFENYIGSQPVVNTIPYFSKFKLRKMLRAICQFRPGKRFTLDGLKAFGLFFLCFGRKRCHYGLENILSLPFTTDEELAEFCKMLHVFQDFRNRAAHEGFQPDASNNIEGIWQSTAAIIDTVYHLKTGTPPPKQVITLQAS